MSRQYFNLSALAAVAKAHDCTVHLHQDEHGKSVFSVGNSDTGAAEYSTYSEAMAFASDSKALEAYRESELCNRDHNGLCPVCSADAEILNVGRNHFGVCREHKIYWPIGSNLFSGWRDEEPATWDANEKLLATYTEASESRKVGTASQLDNVAMQDEVGRMFAEREQNDAPKPADKSNRPQLATLGQCLEEVATGNREGFTKITTRYPEEYFERPRVMVEAATASNLNHAPVTVFIRREIGAAAAIVMLNAAVQWLEKHSDKLSDFTPTGEDDFVPF